MTTYSIVRFRRNGEYITLKMGVTLEEAQEWCSREDTHGEDWFDGYQAEGEGE